MVTPTTLPFQPASMSAAQLAAVSLLARYSGRTHHLYVHEMVEWFASWERNGIPIVTRQHGTPQDDRPGAWPKPVVMRADTDFVGR